MHEKKTLKERIGDFSDLAKSKVQNATDWCKNHKEVIVVFGPVIISGVLEFIKISAKKSSVKEEKMLKDRYIYDRSQGHYYEIIRKPKSSEWIQIDQRKQNGEALGCILDDMGLLKW